MLDWTNQGLDILVPLYDHLKKKSLTTNYFQADETGIKVLDSEKNCSTHQEYLWAYRDVTRNLVLFEYHRGRNKEGPAQMLKDFRGFLQTDGYAPMISSFIVTVLKCCIAWRMQDDTSKRRQTMIRRAVRMPASSSRKFMKSRSAQETFNRGEKETAGAGNPSKTRSFPHMDDRATSGGDAEISDRQSTRVFSQAMEGTDLVHHRSTT